MVLKSCLVLCLFVTCVLTIEADRLAASFLFDDYILREQELRRGLMRNYDKTTMPADLTTVNFRRITLKHFDMNEEQHSLDVDAWFIYEWKDKRLEFNVLRNIEKLSMSPKDIWMPDIKLYNNAKLSDTNPFDDTLTIAYSNGRVLHAPPARLHATCVADLTQWPHDVHNCTIVIGSWVHHGHTIDLRLIDDEPKLDLTQRQTPDGRNISRGEWNLVTATLTRLENSYDCCPEPYVSIWLTLVVARDAPAFNWTVKIPVIGLSILSLLLFVLPPAAGEKLILGGLSLLLDMIYIETVSSTVAHSPSHTPLIVQLVCQQFILVLVSLIIGCVIFRMIHEPHSGGLPTILHKPLTKAAGILCLRGYNNLVSGFRRTSPRSLKGEELELGNGMAPSASQNINDITIKNEWLFLGALVDRFCLIIYTAICLINFVRYHSVL